MNRPIATQQPPVEARGMTRKRKVVGRGYGRDGCDGSVFFGPPFISFDQRRTIIFDIRYSGLVVETP